MTRAAMLAWLALLLAPRLALAETLRVGSKRFPESTVLAELAKAIGERAGDCEKVEHAEGLGGTAVVAAALEGGAIDLYPEYTGTIAEALLARPGLRDRAALDAALAARGLVASPALGFENGYALAVKASSSRTAELRALSDLVARSELRVGISHELLGRSDGWPGLARAYGLTRAPEALDHGLLYTALDAGSLDVVEVYTTDSKIAKHGLRVLVDDRRFFPPYEAVFLARASVPARFPRTWAALAGLAGRLDGATMVRLNAAVELDLRPPAEVARGFLGGDAGPSAPPPTLLRRVGEVTLRDGPRHLALTFGALASAIAIGLPLGVLAHRRPRLGRVVLAAVGVVQTIPSLALFAFLVPLVGIGPAPALLALVVYGLLPIVRNTHAGLSEIPSETRTAARAIGLGARTTLLRVELPLASRTLLAGVRTSAVVAVGTATIAAFVGAGGLGRAISTGLSLSDSTLVLAGALPAALLALGLELVFRGVERVVIPRGLR